MTEIRFKGLPRMGLSASRLPQRHKLLKDYSMSRKEASKGTSGFDFKSHHFHGNYAIGIGREKPEIGFCQAFYKSLSLMRR